MSTTLENLAVRRYVRTVSSGLATNTEWWGLMAANAQALAAAPWHETADTVATLPVNDPTKSFAGATAYDAWRQSGDAIAGTGRQCAYAGMAIYRVALPSGCTPTGVSVRVSGDKFCVGGLTLVAILSDSTVPLAEWGADTTGTARETGLVAETADKVSQSENRSAVATLDLSGSGSYLYLLLALTDYSVARREYWIEGSGCIDAASIAVTVSEDISPAETLAQIPLEVVPCCKSVEGGPPILLQRAWARYRNEAVGSGGGTVAAAGTRLCASLLSGSAAAAASVGGADAAAAGFVSGLGGADDTDLSDRLTAAIGPLAQGHAPGFALATAAAIYLNESELAGRTLRLPIRASDGKGTVRVLLVESATPDVGSIDWTNRALLSGADDTVLAVADASAAFAGETLVLQIRRATVQPFAFLIVAPVSLEETGARDTFRLDPINPHALSIR